LKRILEKGIAVTAWESIANAIGAARGEPFRVRRHRAVGGGCINHASVLEGDDRRYFVKLNDPDRLAMFTAEFAGLEEIRRSGTLRVPTPVCHGIADGRSYLVQEYLDLSGRGGPASYVALGHGLAAMHRVTQEDYGWHIDNTIGSTPQPNRRDTDWIRFWRERRIGFQLELAAANGWGGRLRQQGERLLEALPALLPARLAASLLHGDLWSGNHAFTSDGTPVIFDPAVYYGDRETDLAMTELFGGYSSHFYAAYDEAWPLDPGYPVRKTLYNLYHVLNHLNLFGGGYLSQAERMIASLLAEAGQ
jgi:protein-ribulosamine 3-kinase